jgi:methyltransferase (TIGR00027 family)
MGRALAHALALVPAFRDPTALALLPDGARRRVEMAIEGRTLRSRIARRYMGRLANAMVARTVEIDAAVRAAAAPQLVILGAGLDGRAWRMPELADTVVFEVDHPDSQRDKRLRAAPLAKTAREVRFVAVDFERDGLDDALRDAGHDPDKKTTWVWEGVVMYLALPDVEKTLDVIDRRSSLGSRVVVVYHAHAAIRRVVGFFVARLGEPFRSEFLPEEMRTLLGRFRFGVVRDRDLRALGADVSPEVGRVTRFMKHLRIVTGDRAPGVST